MSVSKFRFVSPGVQTAEIDNSQLPRAGAEIGPVIIGRSLRGPMMRPVRIQSFSDFVDVFGEPVAGGAGGDVWRDGNRLTPTYAVYAAQAYLKNSSPVTFVRLGGYENQNKASSEEGPSAGWEADKAYGLFFAPAVSSSAAGGWKVDGTAALGAIIYSNANLGLVGTGLDSDSGDDVVNKVATWVRIDNEQLATRLANSSLETTSSFNFEIGRAHV